MRLKTTEGERIDLVAAQNDSMAAGARKTIAELRKDWAQVPFTGCDGLPNGGRRMVTAGQLTATIVKPTTTGPAIELVARKLNGERVPSDLVLHAQSHPTLERLQESGDRVGPTPCAAASSPLTRSKYYRAAVRRSGW